MSNRYAATLAYRSWQRGGLVAALLLLGACHHDQATAPAAPANPASRSSATTAAPSASAASSPSADQAASAPRARPDFGGVKAQHVEVTATGPTLERAVANAIRLAVQQVNGQTVTGIGASLDAGASLATGGAPVDFHSQAYADWLVTQTQGVVTHFRVLSQSQASHPRVVDEEHLKASQGESWNKGKFDASEEADASARESADLSARASADGVGSSQASARANAEASEHYEGEASGEWDVHQGASNTDYQHKHTEYDTEWQVKIGADVAVYEAGAESGLTRVVIAMPHAAQSRYPVGDRQVAAADVAGKIKSELTDALTQTHRFTVLDRDDEAEIAQELDLVRSGSATRADTARLGQRLAADLLVIPTIDRFEYIRHERALRLSDRKLVSYSGGGRVSFRVVNAATGQIAMSQSFDYPLPASAPTTMGASPDGDALAHAMMESLDHRIVSAILRSTFPLSVVQAAGRNVVINQGGEAVAAGTTYQAVYLGKAITDPQSGQSLGPTEMPCCSITVDRVTPKLSYGHVVEADVNLGSPFQPGSIELRDPVQPASEVAEQHTTPSAEHQRARPRAPIAKAKPVLPAEDSNW